MRFNKHLFRIYSELHPIPRRCGKSEKPCFMMRTFSCRTNWLTYRPLQAYKDSCSQRHPQRQSGGMKSGKRNTLLNMRKMKIYLQYRHLNLNQKLKTEEILALCLLLISFYVSLRNLPNTFVKRIANITYESEYFLSSSNEDLQQTTNEQKWWNSSQILATRPGVKVLLLI